MHLDIVGTVYHLVIYTDGRIILRWILRKWEGVVGPTWPRGVQEVKAPRFLDIRQEYPGTHF